MGLFRIATAAVCLLAAACGGSGQEPEAVEAPTASPEPVYESAQEHPGWDGAVGQCTSALARTAAEADYYSSIRVFHHYPDLLEPACELLTRCLWQETGNVYQEFTVRSRQALEDCYELVLGTLG